VAIHGHVGEREILRLTFNETKMREPRQLIESPHVKYIQYLSLWHCSSALPCPQSNASSLERTPSFPSKPGLEPLGFFLYLSWNRTFEDKWLTSLWAACPSCHPTNSVKAQKETQSTNSNQLPEPILSISTTGLKCGIGGTTGMHCNNHRDGNYILSKVLSDGRV